MTNHNDKSQLGETALPELMTVTDFIANFRMGRTSFYREVQSGRLHIVKFGRSTRISKSEATAWLARLHDTDEA